MKILLISPGTPDEIDNRIIRSIPYLNAKAFIAPHAVATVAALTPKEHDVSIHDEYIRGPAEKFLPGKNYDIIGISITSNQLIRSLKIAEACKKFCPASVIVVGGIGVEMLIYKQKGNIDVVFHGEAEDTWPQFLEDYKKGNYQKIYKSVIKPDMSKAPPPRWELIKDDIHLYNSVSIQTTRGCPFDCSFCDVIYTYGRKPRSKTIDQVLEEIKRLNDLKVQMVFIADDNFAGDKKYVKELLRQMIVLNNSFKNPMGFFTQIDITIANDDELLALLSDANFYTLMIGIESVNPDSLKDMNKKQNLGVSAVEAIKKIQSYGMVVLAHMIIGNESDDLTVFEKTAAFVKDADIIFHICHPLAAPPGTKMWYDYKRQGRIIQNEPDETSDKMDIISNIIPKQMSRQELFLGLADYWDDIYDTEKFKERATSLIHNIKRRPNVKMPGLSSMWAMRKMMGGVFKYFFFTAEKIHKKTFMYIMKSAKKNISYMMPKIIYIYTFYLIDYKRSQYDAAVAREHARWERENPDKIQIDDSEIPVYDTIREHASPLISEAYNYIWKKNNKKEIIYKAVHAALLEFSDRFGKNFETVDEFYLDQMRNACERVLPGILEITLLSSEELPEKQPGGFTREILDALDNAVRYRNIYG
ncbi:MAG TPA: radical SAM protein [Bacteroidales bacterium]|nr:radical SAM protein [Bacteroidales bacterium]